MANVSALVNPDVFRFEILLQLSRHVAGMADAAGIDEMLHPLDQSYAISHKTPPRYTDGYEVIIEHFIEKQDVFFCIDMTVRDAPSGVSSAFTVICDFDANNAPQWRISDFLDNGDYPESFDELVRPLWEAHGSDVIPRATDALDIVRAMFEYYASL